jgi:hypothetical protein
VRIENLHTPELDLTNPTDFAAACLLLCGGAWIALKNELSTSFEVKRRCT